VLIDLQKGIVSYPTVHPVADVVANAARLARVFRTQRLPVALVNVARGAPGRTEQQRDSGERPSDWDELVPELEVGPGDILVTKRTWGAFPHTDLEERLRAAGTTQIVIAGIATSIGVESTAREAFALGFNVALAVDAMTDMDAGSHQNSIAKIFPRLGETGTTEDIIRMLEER
jgi:nicotinamidase-related amidase